MDRFFSICAMPIGVLLCFGPALVLWITMELKSGKEKPAESEVNRRSPESR